MFTKLDAAKIFGNCYADLARALEMTRGGISQWPQQLTRKQLREVLGEAVLQRKALPKQFRYRVRKPRTPVNQ